MARMSLQAAYTQARQWLESNDLDRAIGLAQHILDSYPSNLEAFRILGEAHLANRQLDRAQEAFTRVLRADPENIPAHVGLGITYERRGQLDSAVGEFEQALEIKPDMPELRSQLLRLYAEAWGSENAQLRLSRAGLARLYAKGHMLSQAIAEFRQVIADQPHRLDAQVALVETLWRNEQEEEAAEQARAVLAEHPEALKPNLILGYLELAAGNPEGERYWQAAYQMDPYQAVAHALFETLPPGPTEEPSVPVWDEEAWRRRRTQELQEEQIAATRPMESASANERDTPVMRPAEATPVAAAVGAAAAGAGEDDFLASLLALDMPAAPPPVHASTPALAPSPAPDEEAEDLDMGMAPFSLADLGLSEEEIAGLESASTPPPAPATPTPAPAAAEPEIEMAPFSLADLGLSEEEIAGLESISETPAAAPAAGAPTPTPAPEVAAAEEPEIEMAPFSLADLGLSEEEIASLESLQGAGGGAPPVTPAALTAGDAADLPVDLQPFSIDELDIGAGDAGRGEVGELPPSLQPFSLEDTPAQPPQRPRMSGLSSEEPYEGAPEEEEPLPGPRGFSWQQPSQRPEPGFVSSMRSAPEQPQGSIFEKLQSRRPTVPPAPPAPPVPPIGEDEHLGLFSLDNVSLRDDEEATEPQAAAEPPPAPVAQPPAEPAPEVESLEEALASGAIQPFSFADLGLSEEEIAALGLGGTPAPAAQEPAPAPAAEEQAIVDLGLEDLEPAAPAPASTGELEEPASGTGELQPFSLADLGLSDEEIADLGLDSGYDDAESRLGLTEEELAGLDSGGDVDWSKVSASAAPAPTPASAPEPAPEQVISGDLALDRLIALGRQQGFVDISDIIAAVENPEEEAARIEEIGHRLHEANIEIRDGDEVIDMDAEYEEEDLSEPPAFEAEAPTATVAGEEVAPFSLRDLGLSDEEIAMLGLGEAQPSPSAQAEDTSPLEPFSLSDLDAPGGAVEPLDLAEATPPPAQPRPEEEPVLEPFSLSELGLTADEVALLGLGESAPPAPAPATPPSPPQQEEEPALEPFSLSELGMAADERTPLELGGPAPTPPEAPPEMPPAPSAPPPSAPPPAAAAPTQAAPAPAPARARQPITTGNTVLDAFFRQLDANPQNHVLRLSIARVCGQVGPADLAVQQYRDLIKRGALLDEVVDDLRDLIADSDDTQLLRRLHRALGDAYSKQGRFQEALEAYSWVPGGSST
ncbi:MAG TPA: tetratricopeptide repeat protein [Roseiflexaceae bacterium]|nr:tetratricopeptide repeat protein [Roseiflexaceae bacterium]